ncbi:MAG: hypothetical protein GY862_18100 [Gammaproteobacteria bacterium]|nr:hypothetical protein [Gammaproteobacteria bacterium]
MFKLKYRLLLFFFGFSILAYLYFYEYIVGPEHPGSSSQERKHESHPGPSSQEREHDKLHILLPWETSHPEPSPQERKHETSHPGPFSQERELEKFRRLSIKDKKYPWSSSQERKHETSHPESSSQEREHETSHPGPFSQERELDTFLPGPSSQERELEELRKFLIENKRFSSTSSQDKKFVPKHPPSPPKDRERKMNLGCPSSFSEEKKLERLDNNLKTLGDERHLSPSSRDREIEMKTELHPPYSCEEREGTELKFRPRPSPDERKNENKEKNGQ